MTPTCFGTAVPSAGSTGLHGMSTRKFTEQLLFKRPLVQLQSEKHLLSKTQGISPPHFNPALLLLMQAVELKHHCTLPTGGRDSPVGNSN